MPDASAKTQILGWLNELLEDPEYQHVFLVDLVVKANNRIEIFIDGDEAVSFRLCQTISRHLEAQLDETQLLGERYTLEVSSPGTTRPLTMPRQFAKHIGRTLDVKINEDTTVSGELRAVTENGLSLSEEVVVRDERKKKKKQTNLHEVAFGEFEGATVQLSFKK